jgi:hypothetical protein
MKRTILLLVFSTVSLFADTPWPGVRFVEVRAYAWPTNMKSASVMLPGKTPRPGAINTNGSVLTPDQTKRLLSAVTGKHQAHASAHCHRPHNAFIVYDSEKKPVAFIEVCFECLTAVVEPQRGVAPFIDLIELARIFDELKLPMGRYPDLRSFQRDFKG